MYNHSRGVSALGRKLGGAAVALSIGLVGIVLLAPPANAVANNTVAFWSMDEAPGATTLVDSSGNGRSGNGSRQSGIWVLDQFTRWQAMNWDYSGHLQKAQMDVADVEATPYRLSDDWPELP